MRQTTEKGPSSFCHLPWEVCGVVASFTSPWDWIKQGRISANHYRGVRSHIRRVLGVTYREMDEATQVFGAGQSAEVQSGFQQWSDSREMPVILMTDCMFVALGFDVASHKPDYDGRVRVKPVDESYWRSNFGSHSVNPWIMLSKPSENPVRLKNIRDMTEVQFRMDGLKALVPGQSAVIQWFDEDGTDMFIHPIDPITHELREKIAYPKPKGWNQLGRVLPFNEHGHPQDLALNRDYQYCIRDAVVNSKGEPFKCDPSLSSPKFTEDYKLALSWLHNTLFITDTQTGRQISQMEFPFHIRNAQFNCNREYLSIQQFSGLWWILNVKNGKLTPISNSCSVIWINQDLFVIRSYIIRLCSVQNPKEYITLTIMNLFAPPIRESDGFVPSRNILAALNRLERPNLIKSNGKLMMLEWEEKSKKSG